MVEKPRRQKAIKRLNLSDHTLDINIRRCNYGKFSFSEIEEYVRGLVGSRDYQYDAIKQIMIYLWGGGYKSIADLGKENYQQKLQIQQRFGTETNFYRNLPLSDRLSGVVHMATGTGKSYVIYATAYSFDLLTPHQFAAWFAALKKGSCKPLMTIYRGK